MRFSNVVQFGAVVIMSVTMVACKSTDDMAEPMPEQAAPVAQTPAGPSAAERAETARREAALATKIFYFEFDKSDLSAAARDALVYHAADLKANPGKRVRLEGHADERGTREYNLALGERRAQSIERYLQVQGVAAGQLETVSYGEERPADSGTAETAYSKNRRVEMK